MQLRTANKMQITTNTNAEVKCICAPQRCNNKNKNSCNNNSKNSNDYNSHSDAYSSIATTIVCNMAAATIPTAMTDDSGCCKCASSSNMQHCGKDVDYIAAASAPAAATALACAERPTPTKCCKQDMQDSLSKYNKNNQHTCAVNCENNFVGSESAKKACKHSAVIRSSGSSENLLATAAAAAAAAEIKTKTTTTKAATTASTTAATTTKMRTAFDIGNWKSVCAMMLLLFCFTWHGEWKL